MHENYMKTQVVGYYSTPFGELWNKSLFDLTAEAVEGALKATKLHKKQIDAVFFGNMLGGILENNLHAGAKIADMLDLTLPIFRVEGACASGGMAFHMAHSFLAAGKGKTVLVVGAEKMTDVNADHITQGLMSAASGEEQECGLTFPGLYALMAQEYLRKYNYTRAHLAAVSVKNHAHGSLNPLAQFKNKITIEDVLSSSSVADPLGVLDCSPVTDGASAIVLTTDPALMKKRAGMDVLATELATDSISLLRRDSLTEIKATQVAAQKAFGAAGIAPKDISIAEVHDCFSIAELFAMEDIGFWKKGEAGHRVQNYETLRGNGSLTVNTSGGLKAAGHPVGATGIKQIGEVYLQLTHKAGARQIKNMKYGLTHNVGGSGGTAVVSIFSI
jgi:acetyl-CoA C-acetyltransferase